MRKKVTLAVFVLLGLLIVFALFFPAIDSHPGAPTARARTEATAIAYAAKAYRIEYGSLPTGSPIQIAASLSGQNPRQIIFIETQPKFIGRDGTFIDPWGVSYVLAFPSESNIVVKSAGKDKILGTADDIEVQR